MKKIQFISFVVFILFFAATGCQKEFSTENGIPDILSAGSLRDTFGQCFQDSVHGTFYNGVVAGSDTAYVEIKVNVTSAGSYNIESDLQNGLQFSDSGYFASTGINTVLLKPVGAANSPVPTVFTISFDSSVCSFIVDVQDSTGTGLGGGPLPPPNNPNDFEGSWQFTTGDGTFTGSFDTALITLDTTIWASGKNMLYMVGYTSSSTDTALTLIMYLPSGNIQTGDYETRLAPPQNAALFAFNFTTGSGLPIYEALPVDPQGSNIKITISSYNAATGNISGTFSGLSADGNSNVNVNVTNGSFTTRVIN